MMKLMLLMMKLSSRWKKVLYSDCTLYQSCRVVAVHSCADGVYDAVADVVDVVALQHGRTRKKRTDCTQRKDRRKREVIPQMHYSIEAAKAQRSTTGTGFSGDE